MNKCSNQRLAREELWSGNVRGSWFVVMEFMGRAAYVVDLHPSHQTWQGESKVECIPHPTLLSMLNHLVSLAQINQKSVSQSAEVVHGSWDTELIEKCQLRIWKRICKICMQGNPFIRGHTWA